MDSRDLRTPRTQSRSCRIRLSSLDDFTEIPKQLGKLGRSCSYLSPEVFPQSLLFRRRASAARPQVPWSRVDRALYIGYVALREPWQKLVDRAEIKDVIYRYANGLDAGSIEVVLECFSPQAHASYNDGAVLLNGVDEIRGYLGSAISKFRSQGVERPSMHIMNNVAITLNAEMAHAETQGIVYLSYVPDGPITVRGLSYIDDFERDTDGWRISHRTHRAHWQFEVQSQAESAAV